MFGMSGWLKTVITVILLATFVDLLLPSSTMQRYVRTVMSLFVLLTLLAPVAQLFQRGWDPQRLFSLVQGEEARMAATEEAGGAMPSLEAIERKADQLKAANATQQKKLVEAQLASQMKASLQGETTLQVESVTVATATDKQNKPYIEHVQVALGPAKPAAAAVGSGGTAGAAGGTGTAGTTGANAASQSAAPGAATATPPPEDGSSSPATSRSADSLGEPLAIEIKPIDPVRIRVQGDSDLHKSAAAAPAAAGAQPPEYRQDENAIDRILGQQYQLPADRIRTVYVGDAEAF
jgi:stage III sporulation protein AF